MLDISSAFFTRLQGDNLQIAELIDLETRVAGYHWTTANVPVTYTLSSQATIYEPFPGRTMQGIDQNIDLSVAVVDFLMANTGDVLAGLLQNNEFEYATIKVGRVFVDTPDLGRMDIYEGKLGDLSYNRAAVQGQARSRWDTSARRWPFYNYSDTCVWRFGGVGCGFDTSSITVTFSEDAGDIIPGSSTTLNLRLADSTLAAYSNNRFDYGRLTVVGGVNSGAVRTIMVHTGDLLQLSHPLPVNSFTAMNVSIFPGCRKRLVADCKSLYNNDENFMGFPWIPTQENAV